MLRTDKQLEGFAIGATDGPFGKVKDFYFDDEAWVIRYMVADTTKWLGGRDVLISPYSLGQPDWDGKTLPVTVTKEQVRNSPGIDSELPVSRQYLGYYGYPYYWEAGGLWGQGSYPGPMPIGRAVDSYDSYQGYLRAPTSLDGDNDQHLRSCNSVRGHHLVATDGEIGHVQGFLLDDATWSIRYLIVDTSNWWMGHQVLVSPEWIDSVNWPESTVTVDLSREQVKNAPPYDASQPFGRDSEGALYGHYRRNGYWREPSTRAAA
jgi:hypothetical protein